MQPLSPLTSKLKPAHFLIPSHAEVKLWALNVISIVGPVILN